MSFSLILRCAMSDNPKLEMLLQQIRNICAEEYKRGEADAIARIMKAASTSESDEKPRTLAADVPRAHVRRSSKSNGTVPRGLPDVFVRRVLTEMPNGISPTAITSHAKTPMEHKISYSAIRQALGRGRRSGSYHNENGKWYKS
jgi:hypothetical protein